MSIASSDLVLWDHVIRGDGRAFGLLFDRHRDRVLRHIRRTVDDPRETEDLTAAVFLELWRRRGAVRIVDESLLPWLLVTATNVTRNANRAKRRYRHFLATLPAAEDVPNFSDRSDRAIDLELQSKELISSIRRLAEVDQQLIVLTALDGLSLSEASRAVGLSYGAAKTRISRARARLGNSLVQSIVTE